MFMSPGRDGPFCITYYLEAVYVLLNSERLLYMQKNPTMSVQDIRGVPSNMK